MSVLGISVRVNEPDFSRDVEPFEIWSTVLIDDRNAARGDLA